MFYELATFIIGIIILVFYVIVNIISPNKIISGGLGVLEHYDYSIEPLNKFAHENITLDVVNSVKTFSSYNEFQKELPYQSTKNMMKLNLAKLGQIKLFLCELQFLTTVRSKYPSGSAYIIYAGSAPGNKALYLSELFPDLTFILVDPNVHFIMHGNKDQYDKEFIDRILYFKAASASQRCPGLSMTERSSTPAAKRFLNIYDRGHILRDNNIVGEVPKNIVDIITTEQKTFYIIEDYFTDDLATLLAPLSTKGRVFFMSDIRTRSEESDSPLDVDIVWNSAQQYNWVTILKPVLYMLKFRTPYDPLKLIKEIPLHDYVNTAIKKSKIDFQSAASKKKFPYLRGDIMLQAYAGTTSTESRLIGSDLYMAEYDCAEYENKYFYWNRVHKPYGWHTSHEKYLDYRLGIDRCGDCALMCSIIEQYINTRKSKFTVHQIVEELFKLVKRDLRKPSFVHGYYYKKMESMDDIDTYNKTLLGLYNITPSFKPIDIIKEPPTLAEACHFAYAVEKCNANKIDITKLFIAHLYGSTSEHYRRSTILDGRSVYARPTYTINVGELDMTIKYPDLEIKLKGKIDKPIECLFTRKLLSTPISVKEYLRDIKEPITEYCITKSMSSYKDTRTLVDRNIFDIPTNPILLNLLGVDKCLRIAILVYLLRKCNEKIIAIVEHNDGVHGSKPIDDIYSVYISK